jgi:hypothetical protein
LAFASASRFSDFAFFSSAEGFAVRARKKRDEYPRGSALLPAAARSIAAAAASRSVITALMNARSSPREERLEVFGERRDALVVGHQKAALGEGELVAERAHRDAER